jgi:hypothetical protein
MICHNNDIICELFIDFDCLEDGFGMLIVNAMTFV